MRAWTALVVLGLAACSSEGRGRDGDCPDACREGDAVCDGAAAKRVCELRGDGCPGWSAVTECGANEICTDGRCHKNCTDYCVPGTALCSAEGVRPCSELASGCFDWGQPQSCPAELVCSGGRCQPRCEDQCTEGQKLCIGSGLVTCAKLATGCTEWVNPSPCPQGEVCSAGACTGGGCTNQCTEGATRCAAGNLVQTCVKLATGCTEWGLPAACPDGRGCPATGSACVVVPCREGERRCAGNTVETCDHAAAWHATQACPQACAAGICTAAAACSPGAVRCNGSHVEICNASGTAWLYNQTCNVGCAAGACTDPCTPGAKRCNARIPETCNAGGTGWSAGSACATDCWAGECVQADLVVDGIVTTLEGEHVYQNSVIVKNGGQLKVGPSGRLVLRAKTLSVDAASTIVASGTGGGSQGIAASPASCCYNSGHSGGTICLPSGQSVGGGSSYGTAATCTNSERAVASDGCSCYVTASNGPTYGTNDQIDIAEGSSDTAGSPGGGLVALYLKESVDLQGSIVANGTGNASGGGILVAADTLRASGPMQAVGGGCGGKGRVKVLRGSTADVTGAIDALKTESIMPPLRLVSGSHPDPERWYNDGLGDWFLAWDRPFPTVNGYYVLASANATDVPSPARGTFLQQESTVVPASALREGQNWFHLASVDSAFKVGTAENSLRVQVNSTPPSVASSSHASQRTWYQNNALYLTWTNPRDDANFTGYYYVLDHFADTVPAQGAGTFTTNPQLLVSNLANGIWAFHLVNRDTRGATTKRAAHYVVYIGTEPQKGNLSGSVFDGSNSNEPLAGVEIRVNRGLFGVGGASNGTYTFSNNLYVGSWEVTAAKAGYAPQTKSVTVSAGQVTTQNFTLTKLP